jgi:hypothetical protein
MSHITWKSKYLMKKRWEGGGGNSVSFESPVLIIKLSCDVIITCNYMKYNIRKRMFKQ